MASHASSALSSTPSESGAPFRSSCNRYSVLLAAATQLGTNDRLPSVMITFMAQDLPRHAVGRVTGRCQCPESSQRPTLGRARHADEVEVAAHTLAVKRHAGRELPGTGLESQYRPEPLDHLILASFRRLRMSAVTAGIREPGSAEQPFGCVPGRVTRLTAPTAAAAGLDALEHSLKRQSACCENPIACKLEP